MAAVLSFFTGIATPVAVLVTALWAGFVFLSQEKAKRKEAYYQRQRALVDQILKDISSILFDEDKSSFEKARNDLQILIVQEAQIFLDDEFVGLLGKFLERIQELQLSSRREPAERKALLPIVGDISKKSKEVLSQYWNIEGEAATLVDHMRKFLSLGYRKTFDTSAALLTSTIGKLLLTSGDGAQKSPERLSRDNTTA